VTLDEIKQYLRDAPNNFGSRDSEPAKQSLAELKEQAVNENNQDFAKTIWCFEKILDIQDKYITAFFQLKAEDFYKGWCSLEQVELGLHFLAPHYQDTSGEFYLPFISKHTSQYQSIFPYKLFMSPEILELEKTCNICSRVVSIRNPCGHRVGEIYDGKMCSRIVTKAEFLGMAIVQNPLQKYTVPFLSDSKGEGKKDKYNYAVIRYLIRRLSSPFHAWDVNCTKRRHPH